jgi:hypothetical protein
VFLGAGHFSGREYFEGRAYGGSATGELRPLWSAELDEASALLGTAARR